MDNSYKTTLLKGSVAFAFYAPFMVSAQETITGFTQNGVGIFQGILLFVLAGFALYGVVVAGSGVMGLMNNSNPNESKLGHFTKLILGAILFSLMALIMAFNLEFFGNDAESQGVLQQLRTTG
jgi:hypothetical protein